MPLPVPTKPHPGLVVVGTLVVVSAATLGWILSQPSEATVEGIVTRTTSSGPLAVSSFDLRTTDGSLLTFDVGHLDIKSGSFNAAHLVSHQTALTPIIVRYTSTDGRLVADRLTDAPSMPSSAP
jgi:hypothetical protein